MTTKLTRGNWIWIGAGSFLAVVITLTILINRSQSPEVEPSQPAPPDSSQNQPEETDQVRPDVEQTEDEVSLEDEADPEVEAGPNNQTQAPEEPPAPEPVERPPRTAPGPAQDPDPPEPVANLQANPSPLPEGWEQLSEAEKIALNPLDCLPNNQGTIKIDSDTGDCLPNPDQKQEPSRAEPNQGINTVKIGSNQSFRLNIGNLKLSVVAKSFSCRSMLEIVLQRAGSQDPAQIQAAFDHYQAGPGNLSLHEYLGILRPGGKALDHMSNLKSYLERQQDDPVTTADVWRGLSDYKECILNLSARNIGIGSHTFNDGCGLSLDRQTRANDSQGQSHQPFNLGPGLICTKDIVPFPWGSRTQVEVRFTVPAETQIDSIDVDDDRSGIQARIIGIDSSLNSP